MGNIRFGVRSQKSVFYKMVVCMFVDNTEEKTNRYYMTTKFATKPIDTRDMFLEGFKKLSQFWSKLPKSGFILLQ